MNKRAFELAFFRKRARQCRHLAHGMRSQKIQSQLMTIALAYEAIAAQLEAKKPADLAAALARRSQLKRKPIRSPARRRSGWLH